MAAVTLKVYHIVNLTKDIKSTPWESNYALYMWYELCLPKYGCIKLNKPSNVHEISLPENKENYHHRS